MHTRRVSKSLPFPLAIILMYFICETFLQRQHTSKMISSASFPTLLIDMVIRTITSFPCKRSFIDIKLNCADVGLYPRNSYMTIFSLLSISLFKSLLKINKRLLSLTECFAANFNIWMPLLHFGTLDGGNVTS